ncbi:helix-turn-helix domain-containing protein [Providencia manganoxydans]|uniref:helix-turn-helix domain-containing protein n=1 Tax=Providencia manganoxydans TaxID=2923283 RepID=UPI0034E576AA
MNFSQNNTKVLQLNKQVATLLFCALESSSTQEIQSLIEMAIEKNELANAIIKNEPEETGSTGAVLTALKNRVHNIKPQNSFAARLRLALANSGMKQADLAEWIGVSQGTISSYITGKAKEAGITRGRLMAQALRVNALWLIYGEGEMLLAPNFSDQNTEV